MPRLSLFGTVLAGMTAVSGAALACEIHAPAVKSATPAAVIRHLPTIGSGAFAPFVPPVLADLFEGGSLDGLRVAWDSESGSWGVMPADPVQAAVFGTRLPSDHSLMVTRADGTGLLLTGPEGTEYLLAQRGPGGRWLTRCLPHGLLSAPASVAETFPEK